MINYVVYIGIYFLRVFCDWGILVFLVYNFFNIVVFGFNMVRRDRVIN